MSPIAAARAIDVSFLPMTQSVRIAKILCASEFPAPDGRPRSLCAAERSDGTFCVLLDGEIVDGCAWEASGLKDCIDSFLALRLEMRLQASQNDLSPHHFNSA